jgi:hydroxymethylpyrimidine/phosphomethylpyrimidine kinase
MMNYKRVLTIAGSDSGGGAGIQADIKTLSALGCYATTAVTAVTSQNTQGITGIFPMPSAVVKEQIIAVLSDIGTDAIKIGMLPSSGIIQAVSNTLKQYSVDNIVLDPVMVSTSGTVLMQADDTNFLIQELLQIARVITPNIPEAEALSGTKLNDSSEMPDLAKILSLNRTVSVLLKGGHLDGQELCDVFYNAETDETLFFHSRRIETLNTHGTGCTLSSALTAGLAQGLSLNEAFYRAEEYLHEALASGSMYSIGTGSGPLHFFCKVWV